MSSRRTVRYVPLPGQRRDVTTRPLPEAVLVAFIETILEETTPLERLACSRLPFASDPIAQLLFKHCPDAEYDGAMIAALWGLSRERVRGIESEAIMKLRGARALPDWTPDDGRYVGRKVETSEIDFDHVRPEQSHCCVSGHTAQKVKNPPATIGDPPWPTTYSSD